MQNMDFYSGRTARVNPSQLNVQDPEYFTRLDNIQQKEMDRTRKKASRMMSLIIGLCIISFTSGLILGIKFASGSKKEIMDANTKKAVTDIGSKVSNLLKDSSINKDASAAEMKKNLFPRAEYPYVISLSSKFSEDTSQEIARHLSQKGHTVILSKQENNRYNIFIGPYKNQADAQASLKKITGYNKKVWYSGSTIIKR